MTMVLSLNISKFILFKSAQLEIQDVYVLHQYDRNYITQYFNFHWLQNYLTLNTISISIKFHDYCSNISKHIITLTEHSDEQIDF